MSVYMRAALLLFLPHASTCLGLLPARRLLSKVTTSISASPALSGGSFAAGVLVGLAASGVIAGSERWLTADDVPGSVIRSHKSFTASVVKVSDGDTIRIRHLPWSFSSGGFTGKLSDNTIPLRLTAVDAPEVAKFGKPAQPFGDEAKQYASSLVEGRRVTVRPYARDQCA